MKKYTKEISIIILMVFAVEIFVFNFASIKSLFYNEHINVSEENINLSGITYDEQKKEYKVVELDNYIEIVNINKKIKNLYLNINTTKRDYKITLNYTDDAFDSYNRKAIFETSLDYIISNNIEKTKYIELEFTGKTKSIKLNTNLEKFSYFTIDKISFNKIRPLFFSEYRVLILIIISIFIYSFFKVNIFRDKIKEKNKNQNRILITACAMFLLLSLIIYNNAKYDYTQYNYRDLYGKVYVDALIEKKYTILDNLIPRLEKIENVYDASVMYKDEMFFRMVMDTSYYNGNIYMYFGVFPALIQAVYKNVTGNYLFHSTLTMIIYIITVIYMVKLIKKIITKYFPDTSFGLSLLLILFFLFNSRLFLMIYKTSFYDMLILFGVFFSIFGLYHFLLGTEKNKKLHYFIGSLSLALAVSCRPTTILISIIPLILIFKDLKLNKKLWIYYLTPYVIIGSLLTWFNYIRFGNIFEFGQHYQMTIISMQDLGIRWYAIKNGIWSYLLSFPNIIPTFPFVINSSSLPMHMTFYFNTDTFGGILPMTIIGYLLFYFPFVSKNIFKENKKIFYMIISTIVIGLLLVAINSNIGGSTNRYTTEFTWLFLIGITLFILYLVNYDKNFKGKAFKVLSLILILISIFINLMITFDDKNNTKGVVIDNALYYKVKSLFQ
jgi:hypothetical protein